jgi:hypothetical protein
MTHQQAGDYRMRWKIEAGIIGAACLALGTFLHVQTHQQEVAGPSSVDHFTQYDYDVFDRDFALAGSTCEVGLKSQKLCLANSPLEKQVRRGEILPAFMPAMPAEFRVILETSLKNENLRTVRYGQTLVLLDAETRRVEDVLHLTAPDYVTAQGATIQPKV